MILSFFRRKAEPIDTLLERELDDGLSELGLTPGNLAKKRAISARDELVAENEEDEGQILAIEGRILNLECAISDAREAIADREASINERNAIIAVLDRAKADIDALSDPPAQPSKQAKSRKARGQVAA